MSLFQRARRLLRNPIAIWSVVFLITSGGGKVLQFGVYTYCAMRMSDLEYGAFGLFCAIQAAVAMFAASGIHETATAAIRGAAAEQNRTDLYGWCAALFPYTWGVTLCFVIPIGYLSVGGDLPPLSFAAAVVIGTCFSFGTLQALFLRFENRNGLAAAINDGLRILVVATMGIALWCSGDLEVMVLAGAFAAMTGLLLFWLRGGMHFRRPPDWSWIRTGLEGAWPYGLIGVFGWLSGYGINLVTNEVLDLRVVAIFTFLLSISSLIPLLVTPLDSLWVVRFCDLHRSGRTEEADSKNCMYSRGLACLLTVFSLALLLCYLVATRYIPRLESYAGYVQALALLLAGYILAVPCWHFQRYYAMLGLGKRLMRVYVWAGFLGLALWVLAMVQWQEYGVCLGFLANILVKSVLISIDGKRTIQDSAPWGTIVAGAFVVIAGAHVLESLVGGLL